MRRSSDGSRSKWFAQGDAEGLVAKCGGSSGLLTRSLHVGPRTLSCSHPPKGVWSCVVWGSFLSHWYQRLTKPLKLINFSCACRDIRLISSLSSGAGAVQLPDSDKRRELQSQQRFGCLLLRSISAPDKWWMRRTEAASQTYATYAYCAEQHNPSGIVRCVYRQCFPKACTAVVGGRLHRWFLREQKDAGGGGSFWKFTSKMQMLSFIKTHLKPSVINKHETLSQLRHAVDYGSLFFFFSCIKQFAP